MKCVVGDEVVEALEATWQPKGPMGHTVKYPTNLHLPAPHSMHTPLLPAPVTEENVPAGQAMQ